MTRQRREALLQAAVIKAVNLTEHFTAIPVGQYPTVGGRQLSGHPDLIIVGGKHLAYPSDRIFYVELKSETGKLRESQKKWYEKAFAAGASVYICRSVLEVLGTCFNKNELYGWEPDERLNALVEGLL